MTRLLGRALLVLALCCCTGCEGTETGNPDPARPHDDGGIHTPGDAGVPPGKDGGITFPDAGSVSDAGSQPDAGGPADAATGDDGGQDEDAGS